MPSNLFSDHLIFDNGTNHDIRHSETKRTWWMNREQTISRFNPMESPDLLPPHPFEDQLRPGRGFTYLIKCNITG